MKKLREIVGVGMDNVNVTKITIDNRDYEVVIDPDDYSIFTIFTDPSFVTHRWSYKHDIEANFLVEKLRQTVKLNNLENNLEVLEPFPDGGVQVIRKDDKTGKTIDKSYILEAIKMIYPNNKNLPVSMFGDGHNDIPAMSPEKNYSNNL